MIVIEQVLVQDSIIENVRLVFLKDYISSGCYTIVLGPRNIGKSEPVKYMSWTMEKCG